VREEAGGERRVKGARFTLNPALVKGFRGLVKGETYLLNLLCKGMFFGFQPKKRLAKDEKKIIAMPSVNHHDVSAKPSRCFFQTIVKTLLYHCEDFFVPFRRLKKSIMMSSGKHYSVLEKAL
jgi:hypothetical protein